MASAPPSLWPSQWLKVGISTPDSMTPGCEQVTQVVVREPLGSNPGASRLERLKALLNLENVLCALPAILSTRLNPKSEVGVMK